MSRRSRIIDKLTSYAGTCVLVLFMGNLGVSLPLVNTLFDDKKGFVGPRPAAIGTVFVWGLWWLTHVGGVAFAFFEQYSFRRLKSQRLRFFKILLLSTFPIRFVCTVLWLCTLAFIKHTADQAFLTLAGLLDMLLLAQFALWFFSSQKVEWLWWLEDAIFSGKSHVRPTTETKGCISADKATSIVEARTRQYGPALERLMQSDSEQKQTPPVPLSSTVVYAPLEGDDFDGSGKFDSIGLTEQEREEIGVFPGFIRCACCVDYQTKSTRITQSHYVEAATSINVSDFWHRDRKEFLEKPPISGAFGYVSNDTVISSVHRLCGTCKYACRQIVDHRESHQDRNRLSKLLNPKHATCSIQHYTNPASLKRSSTECHLCALIWNCLNTEQQTTLVSGDELLLKTSKSTSQKSALAQRRSIRLVVFDNFLVPHFGGFKRPRRWEPLIPGFIGMKTDVGSEFAHPLYLANSESYTSGPISLPVSHSTGSETAINLVANVLKSQNMKTTKCPSRLLDVREFPSGKTRIRVGEFLQQEEDTQYVALSHCWGKINIPRLLLENFNEYTEAIEIAKLPKTFQEAIEVTHRLGINYLWIDSLCIIQDSPKDWAYEAALMADIYKDAVCTIAAVAALDGRGGLFRPQDPLKSSPCFLGMEDYGTVPVYAVPCAQSEDSRLNAELMLSQWNSRGWCLQERFLSSTIVYFCESQIYIGRGNQLALKAPEPSEDNIHGACFGNMAGDSARSSQEITLPPTDGTLEAARDAEDNVRLATPVEERWKEYSIKGQLEMYGIWDSEFRRDHNLRDTGHNRQSFVEQRLGKNIATDGHSVWWAAVNEYTSRNLTKPSDKLPAIAGLAKSLYDRYPSFKQNSKNILGIWTDRMIAGLLWYVDLGAHCPRPVEYRAPGWSWAAVEGVISNDSLGLDENRTGVQILSIDIKSDNLQTTWLQDKCAEGSSITLRGLVTTARWTVAASEPQKRYYVARSLVRHEDMAMEDSSALPDFFSSVSTEPKVGPLCHALLHPQSGERVGWFLPDSSAPIPQDLYCLRIKVCPKNTQDPQAIWAVRGLVLTVAQNCNETDQITIADIDQKCYKRIGYFELDVAFKGTSVGREPGGVHAIVTRRGTSHVATGREFAIMNEPDLDPLGFFDKVEMRSMTIV